MASLVKVGLPKTDPLHFMQGQGHIYHSSLLRLEQQQKRFLIRITSSLSLIWNWNNNSTFSTPVVPLKIIPDSRSKWAKSIPVFRPKRRKHPTQSGGTRLLTVPIFPWDRRDIASLTINGGHLDFQNVPRGRASGSSLDTHASVTQSALSRRSYEKIGDCEQSTVGRHIPLLII